MSDSFLIISSKVGSGKTPLGGDSVYTFSGHPFVRSQNVGEGSFLLNDIAYIDKQTHDNQISTELNLNDVLLNITGASIGRTAVVDSRLVGGNVNQHVCIIRLIKNIYSPHLLCYECTSCFISATYILNGRKVATGILTRAKKMKI